MATVNLGRVSFVMKGAYSTSATYKRQDVVTDGGASYAAKKDVPANTALTNTEYWQKLVETVAGVEIGDTATYATTELLFNPEETNEHTVPEVDDDSVSEGDTWSSSKINGELSDLKNALNVTNVEVFGGIGEGFPLEFENGTYRLTSTGTELVKYYAGGYDLTRKVVKSTTFTPPCSVNIKAKDGYSFTVFLSTNGVISSSTGLVTKYTMLPGQQYGMTLRTTGGSDDISSVPVSSIIEIEYASEIDKCKSEIDKCKSAFDQCFNITKSINLINPDDIVIGTIDNNGEPQSDTTYRRTDNFIEVKPNTTYAFRRLVTIFTYDSNKNFIEKLPVGTSAQSRQFGANAYYIKAISNVDNTVYRWLLNEGSEVKDVPWQPASVELGEDVLITEQIDTTLTKSGKAADAKAVGDALTNITGESDYNHGPYITKSIDFGGYYENSLQSFSAEEFDNNTTYAYVIEKFDALMALDSGYVTKNTLGQASGTDLYIYEYVITPHNYTGGDIATYIPDKTPVILCNAGIHGFEKNGVYALYYFLKDLLTNWNINPILMALRNSVCFKVIPVSNPYGFNNDIYYNANNVNINRNFDTPGWTSVMDSESQNSGLAPFDQPEAVILKDWLNANKANTLMFFDIHTNGHYYATGYNNANALLARVYSDDVDSYFKRLAKVFIRHINRQTVKLPTLYPALSPANSEYIGRYQENRTNFGTSTGWGALNGFLSMTFELFNGLNITGSGHVLDLFTADTKKCCSEMLGNIIAETIMEYSIN